MVVFIERRTIVCVGQGFNGFGQHTLRTTTEATYTGVDLFKKRDGAVACRD